jgi:hypothetical protein
MNKLQDLRLDLSQGFLSKKVRVGAGTASSFCGEKCGVGLAKVWGKKFPAFGDPASAPNHQGNRERKTEREEI